MKILALITILFSQSALAYTKPFVCMHNLIGGKYSMEVASLAGELVGEMDWTTGNNTFDVKVINLSAAAASKNPYVVTVARHLKLNWNKVGKVTVYILGNYEDDGAGGVGVIFFDRSGNAFEQGMIFGWAGPLTCK